MSRLAQSVEKAAKELRTRGPRKPRGEAKPKGERVRRPRKPKGEAKEPGKGRAKGLPNKNKISLNTAASQEIVRLALVAALAGDTFAETEQKVEAQLLIERIKTRGAGSV